MYWNLERNRFFKCSVSDLLTFMYIFYFYSSFWLLLVSECVFVTLTCLREIVYTVCVLVLDNNNKKKGKKRFICVSNMVQGHTACQLNTVQIKIKTATSRQPKPTDEETNGPHADTHTHTNHLFHAPSPSVHRPLSIACSNFFYCVVNFFFILMFFYVLKTTLNIKSQLIECLHVKLKSHSLYILAHRHMRKKEDK